MILSDPIFSFQMTLKLREQRLSITSAVNIEEDPTIVAMKCFGSK